MPQSIPDLILDALWDGFETDDNCYADREMSVIDTGGSFESVNFRRIAEHIADHLSRLHVIDCLDQLIDLRCNARTLEGSIIRDRLGKLWESNPDGTWCILGRPDSGNLWCDRDVPPGDMELPAILLWEPAGLTPNDPRQQ